MYHVYIHIYIYIYTSSAEEDATVEGIVQGQVRETMGSIATCSQPFASALDVESEAEEDWNTGAPLWPRPKAHVAYATSAREF